MAGKTAVEEEAQGLREQLKEAQDALACLVSGADCSVRYRQRVLKPLVAALQKDRSIELSESLIECFYDVRQVALRWA